MATNNIQMQIAEARNMAAQAGPQAGIEFLMFNCGWIRADAEQEFSDIPEPKRAPKRVLYEGFKPKEGDRVQFVGVYVLDWRPEWGVPTMAFVEYEGEVDSEQ